MSLLPEHTAAKIHGQIFKVTLMNVILAFSMRKIVAVGTLISEGCPPLGPIRRRVGGMSFEDVWMSLAANCGAEVGPTLGPFYAPWRPCLFRRWPSPEDVSESGASVVQSGRALQLS